LRRARSARQLVERLKREAAGQPPAAETDLPYLLGKVSPGLLGSLGGLSRAAILVRSLNEIARVDADEMTPISLNLVISDLLVTTREQYQSVADVETDLAELPPVTCHAGNISQVLDQMIANACGAIRDGVNAAGERGRIGICTRREGGTVVVRIADTGGGISAQIGQRLFDPLFAGKPIGPGAGRGLALAQSIIDAHGGRLSFETEVGKGTVYSICLPIDGRAVSLSDTRRIRNEARSEAKRRDVEGEQGQGGSGCAPAPQQATGSSGAS
jgi:signal transduction histidine kinase